MKRFLFLLLALLLWLPTALAAPELLETAKSHLTEVYGYTAEDADNFQFSDDKKGTLSFWPKDRPEWIYTLVYSESGVDDVGATTPFYSGLFLDFPGENDIRRVLNAARQNGWFQRWDRAAVAPSSGAGAVAMSSLAASMRERLPRARARTDSLSACRARATS